jgi:MerR family transcriptional regulator, heat shock protein HspR
MTLQGTTREEAAVTEQPDTSPLPASGRGVYGISVAAELAGLHPQTLRGYERRGLVDPERTDGGTRRYSQDDVTRLRRIAELAAAGVNVAGIEVVLELQEETSRLRAELRAAGLLGSGDAADDAAADRPGSPPPPGSSRRDDEPPST